MLALTAGLLVCSACTRYVDNIHTLQALVEDGTIGEEALKNIAALRNGSLQMAREDEQGEVGWETVEYTPTPVSQELSEEQRFDILKDFKDFIAYRYETAHADIRVTQSEIVAFYGVYGGQTVVEIEFDVSGTTIPDEKSDLIISDYYLGKIGGNCLMICWEEDGR